MQEPALPKVSRAGSGGLVRFPLTLGGAVLQRSEQALRRGAGYRLGIGDAQSRLSWGLFCACAYAAHSVRFRRQRCRRLCALRVFSSGLRPSSRLPRAKVPVLGPPVPTRYSETATAHPLTPPFVFLGWTVRCVGGRAGAAGCRSAAALPHPRARERGPCWSAARLSRDGVPLTPVLARSGWRAARRSCSRIAALHGLAEVLDPAAHGRRR